MIQKLKENQKGFTIIEVLIVLAIAGLIMVIVFLAVPALQRNSRNTQRTNDATKISAAVAQCMANRNGQIASCDTTGELEGAGGLDMTKLSQIQSVAVGTGSPATPSDLSTANAGFSAKCSSDGASVEGGTPRQAAVIYNVEDSGGDPQPRCVDV